MGVKATSWRLLNDSPALCGNNSRTHRVRGFPRQERSSMPCTRASEGRPAMVCAVPALLFGRGIEVDSSGGLRPQGWVLSRRGIVCVRCVCIEHAWRVCLCVHPQLFCFLPAAFPLHPPLLLRLRYLFLLSLLAAVAGLQPSLLVWVGVAWRRILLAAWRRLCLLPAQARDPLRPRSWWLCP